MSDARIIVIVGMMGTGKTTIGRRVAELLDVSFHDNDDLIAETTQQAAADLLRVDATRFRAQELACIQQTLNANRSCVLATGGGAPATPAVAELLRAHSPVVWLKVSEAEIANRIRHESDGRPMLDGDFDTRLRHLMEERTPLYESIADVIIDAAADPDSVAKAVVEAVS